jgi:predicted nucleic acid-binding Zn ribbon protein
MRWLRAGQPPLREFLAAGEMAGLPMSDCPVCGKRYHPGGHGIPKTACSAECRRVLRRPKNREAKREEWHRRREVLIARQQAKRKLHGKRYDQAKWRRTKADPKKYAAARAKAREYYRRHAEAIHSRRRSRAAALSDEQLLARIEKARAYTRDWRRRHRGETADKDQIRRRSDREIRATAELRAMREELQTRLEKTKGTENAGLDHAKQSDSQR